MKIDRVKCPKCGGTSVKWNGVSRQDKKIRYYKCLRCLDPKPVKDKRTGRVTIEHKLTTFSVIVETSE